MPRLSVVESRESAEERLKARLAAEENRTLLRFLTCGSVDDGKSTLIGRLLYDSAQIYEDQLKSAERDSKRPGGEWRARPRAPGRRPPGGARAEDHHRRRLSLFLDAAPQIHRRRYAGPCAVHAQHGDRRSNCDFAVLLVDARTACLPRRGATPASCRCSASASSRSRSTRWTLSISARRASTRSPTTSRPLPSRSASSESPYPGLGAQGRQCARPEHAYALVSRPDSARTSRDGRRDAGREVSAVPVSRAMGEPAASRLPRLRRDDRERKVRPGDEVRHPAFGQARARRTHRHRRRRP